MISAEPPPTPLTWLAPSFNSVITTQAGIVHVTNRGECTWYDLAKEVVGASGLSTVIHPTTTDKFPRPAPRPNYSVLSPRSLDAYGITMPGWKDAVGRYLAERKSAE